MTTFRSGAVLDGALDADTEAVALLLHGASVSMPGVASWFAPAPWRMKQFRPAIRSASGGRIRPLTLRHPERSMQTVFRGALSDTAAALAHIRRTAPGARIALVGHSNGGRVALRLSADSRVDAVAALAPWITDRDRTHPRAGVPVLLMHGDLDFVTSPQLTEQLAARLRRGGTKVQYESVTGENHFLLARPGRWHTKVAAFLAEELL